MRPRADRAPGSPVVTSSEKRGKPHLVRRIARLRCDARFRFANVPTTESRVQSGFLDAVSMEPESAFLESLRPAIQAHGAGAAATKYLST